MLRTWFDRDANTPTWWHAEQDPVVGPALRLIYNNPALPWTVANLAAAVSCSRAAFARRFTEEVGEPPIALSSAFNRAYGVSPNTYRRAALTSGVAPVAMDPGQEDPSDGLASAVPPAREPHSRSAR